MGLLGIWIPFWLVRSLIDLSDWCLLASWGLLVVACWLCLKCKICCVLRSLFSRRGRRWTLPVVEYRLFFMCLVHVPTAEIQSQDSKGGAREGLGVIIIFQ